MSSISGISGASAWMRQDSLRSQQPSRLFTKADADGSSGVEATELTSALQAVADTNGDQSLDGGETQRLVGYIADALQALDNEDGSDTGSTATATATATANNSDTQQLDLTALAELVRKQYEQLAATATTGGTLDTSA